jgi:plastocyanin
MGRRVARALAVLLALSLAAAGCGSDEPAADQAPQEGATSGGEAAEEEGTIVLDGQEANDHGAEDVSGAGSLELELDDFYFEPTVLRGAAGQEVTLELFNEGENLHSFTVEDQGIDQDVEPEATAEVTVTFPDSGTLVFICEYHAGQGMAGALEVA